MMCGLSLLYHRQTYLSALFYIGVSFGLNCKSKINKNKCVIFVGGYFIVQDKNMADWEM